MENVLKGHIILSNQINMLNVISKYHTTTDHTKHHMKIHTMKNPYHCSLCAKKSISRSHMKSPGRENLNPYAPCGREVMSYQGTTQRDTIKGSFSRIYITVLCVAKDLYLGTKRRDT